MHSHSSLRRINLLLLLDTALLKYRHVNLSVAGHSLLARESTNSASPEYQAVIGHVRLRRPSAPPPRHTIPRRTPATYVPTQELEKTIEFRLRQFM